jgi:hypothetical protein
LTIDIDLSASGTTGLEGTANLTIDTDLTTALGNTTFAGSSNLTVDIDLNTNIANKVGSAFLTVAVIFSKAGGESFIRPCKSDATSWDELKQVKICNLRQAFKWGPFPPENEDDLVIKPIKGNQCAWVLGEPVNCEDE